MMTDRASAETRGTRASTVEDLTIALAEQVMTWRALPERFLMGRRRWIPHWRFQPLTNLEHALKLLETAASTFTLALKSDGTFSAQVQVKDHAGRAVGTSKAATITVAVARAIGLDVPDGVLEAKKR